MDVSHHPLKKMEKYNIIIFPILLYIKITEYSSFLKYQNCSNTWCTTSQTNIVWVCIIEINYCLLVFNFLVENTNRLILKILYDPNSQQLRVKKKQLVTV